MTTPIGRPGSVHYRWEILVMLWCAYFLHQADKQIFSVVLPALRGDLKLSGYEAGLVATVFTLVLAFVSPLAGALGDRLPKHNLLIAAVAIWSAGTALTAGASSLALLLLFRSAVTGGAESFYPPVSHAFIAEHHKGTRALAMSIHQTAQYSGPIASGFLSGWIAERAGWRWGFVIFGLAGLALSLWMAFRLRSNTVTRVRPPGENLLSGFAHCFKIAAVRRMGFAFASVLFVTLGYSTWAPTIFGREFGLSLSQAGFQTSAWTSLSAMAGALLGGALSDRQASFGKSRLRLQSLALLCATPFVWMLGAAHSLPFAFTALAGVGFFRGIYEGTIAVTLYDAIDERYRSAAAAVVLLIANLLAAPSSALLGWISDHADLGAAVSALSVCFVTGAGVLFSASRLPQARSAAAAS